MATLETFKRFYTTRGIRVVGQMITLRPNQVSEFKIPMGSAIHVAIRNIGDLGLTEDDEVLVNSGKRFITNYVKSYSGKTVGSPIAIQRVMNKEIKPFLKRNKNFKYIGHSQAWVNVPTIPYIINYSSIDKTYKYRQREGVQWWRTANFFNTVIDGIVAELDRGDRNNFFLFDPPSRIPSISRLKGMEAQWAKDPSAELPIDKRHRQILNSDGAYILLQLWLWAGENSHLSIFSKLPKDKLDRVLLLSMVGERYTTVSLGMLDSWIRRDSASKGSLSPERAQKVIMRHFMSIIEQGVVTESIVEVDEDEPGEDDSLADQISDNEEYKTETPHKPKLDVNIDSKKFDKGNTIKVDAKTKADSLSDKIFGEPNDAEDFLFHQMDIDLEQHSASAAQIEVEDLAEGTGDIYKPYEPEEVTFVSNMEKKAIELERKGLYTAAEVRRAQSLATRYKTIPSPVDPSQTLEEYLPIDPSDLEIEGVRRLSKKKIKGIVDDSMMNYSLKGMTGKYIDEILYKDVMNSVMHFQKAGVAVTDVRMERTDELLGSYHTVSVQFTPLVGKPSTCKFQIPVYDSDGHMTSNGVKSFQKYQRRDVVIRKTDHDTVALTSYMSKMFVKRTERVRFNYGMWLVNQISKMSLDAESGVTAVKREDVHVVGGNLPNSYCDIARSISEFDYKGVRLNFDYSALKTKFSQEVLDKVDLVKYVPIAQTSDSIYVMDKDDKVSILDMDGKVTTVVGTITNLLGIPRSSEPVDFAEVTLLGSDIPMGVLLGYRVGLGRLLATIKSNYRRVPRGEPTELSENEFEVRFEDETLVFSKDDRMATLIFNGFNRVKTTIRKMSIYLLDKPDNYATILNALGAPLSHTRQYDLIFDVWIDHLAEDCLKRMNEPTDMFMLFLSAVEKLCDNNYRDHNDVVDSLFVGYQRVSGFVYDAMYNAMRAYNRIPPSKNSSISINPKEVWFSIIQDETVAPIEESNPIHGIKEQEIAVFRGKGGRSARTMTAKHRRFTDDSIGIVSEANVDNGQVGTINYLTADPNITSLRGNVKPIEDLSTVPATKVQSTAMLLSPGSDMDD